MLISFHATMAWFNEEYFNFPDQNKAATDNTQPAAPDIVGGVGGIPGIPPPTSMPGMGMHGMPGMGMGMGIRPGLGRGFCGFPAGRGGLGGVGGGGGPSPSGSGAAGGQATLWANTKFSNDKDGKMAEKFRRLMGCKDAGKSS